MSGANASAKGETDALPPPCARTDGDAHEPSHALAQETKSVDPVLAELLAALILRDLAERKK